MNLEIILLIQTCFTKQAPHIFKCKHFQGTRFKALTEYLEFQKLDPRYRRHIEAPPRDLWLQKKKKGQMRQTSLIL